MTRPSGENLIACIRINLSASIPMKINMKWKESKQERKVMLIEVDIELEKKWVRDRDFVQMEWICADIASSTKTIMHSSDFG